MFNKFWNFFKNSEKSLPSFILIAYLNLADLDGGLLFNSFALGKIGFLLINLNKFFFIIAEGKYLDVFLNSE